jgi:hypothetical protein
LVLILVENAGERPQHGTVAARKIAARHGRAKIRVTIDP